MQRFGGVCAPFLWASVLAIVVALPLRVQGVEDDDDSYFVSDAVRYASFFDETLPPLPSPDGAEELIEEPDPQQPLSEEIQALRERLEQLEQAEQKRTAEEKKKKDADAKKGGGKADEKAKDNVWIDVSDEKWNVRMGGDVQMDMINWAYADPAIAGPAAGPGARDYFEFRRLRLTAEGTGYGIYDFRLQFTLESDTVGNTQTISSLPTQLNPNTPSVKDAYFSINEIPWIGRMRVGNFFVPYGLEQVTNDRFGVFMERSIPTQGVFTADRQVGIATYNTNDAQNVTWSSGMFYDSISETQKVKIDGDQGLRLSHRVTWLPYYDEASNGRYLVHTGAGAMYVNRFNHIVQFRTRPEIHQGPYLIDTGPMNSQSYTTANIEGALVWANFSIQTEAYITGVGQQGQSNAIFHGAYAYVSYFLTGENRNYERFGQHGAQFTRLIPNNNVFFTPGGFSLGAWEAKARWSYLSLDSIGKGRLDDLTVGFNWYWSERTRMFFDYIHPFTSQSTTFGNTQSDILAMRFDFNW